MSNFMNALEKTSLSGANNVSVTENGATGYRNTKSKLVDLNFMLSSMRNMGTKEIWARFLDAYAEDPNLAVIWLFFARDREEGCGERRTFRVIFNQLCHENPDLAKKLLQLIPRYGRWDDLIDVYFSDAPCIVRDEAFNIIDAMLSLDLDRARAGKPVSLLAKWMPSPATSSFETCRRANVLRCQLGWTPKQYRKTLSRLRKVIGVVEQSMSANEWDKINYEHVPSKASMIYRDAFRRHDNERYDEYLSKVKSGEAKIHAGVLYPYDIVHAYGNNWSIKPVDDTLEEQWKALPDNVPENESTLVVVDGSGSMSCRIGNNTQLSCHDVARSLAIYFAERIKGEFHNKFITFSATPRLVTFNDGMSLRNRIDLLRHYDECSNTNIEATFDLILKTAVENNLKAEDIPANILIISDMEFDAATACYSAGTMLGRGRFIRADEKLFDTIRRKWKEEGYRLPRLVFWNVCSRTGTIPVAENDLGVALVSGFSPNIADMVMSGELDPYTCLVNKLLSGRYEAVEKVLKE